MKTATPVELREASLFLSVHLIGAQVARQGDSESNGLPTYLTFVTVTASNLGSEPVVYDMDDYYLAVPGPLSRPPVPDSYIRLPVCSRTLRARDRVRDSVVWVFEGSLTENDVFHARLMHVPVSEARDRCRLWPE